MTIPFLLKDFALIRLEGLQGKPPLHRNGVVATWVATWRHQQQWLTFIEMLSF